MLPEHAAGAGTRPNFETTREGRKSRGGPARKPSPGLSFPSPPPAPPTPSKYLICHSCRGAPHTFLGEDAPREEPVEAGKLAPDKILVALLLGRVSEAVDALDEAARDMANLHRVAREQGQPEGGRAPVVCQKRRMSQCARVSSFIVDAPMILGPTSALIERPSP